MISRSREVKLKEEGAEVDSKRTTGEGERLNT